jgi:PAS domain-containing protein
MPDAVLIVEVPSLRVLFANQFAESFAMERLGRPPRLGLAEVEGEVRHPDGSTYDREDWPIIRATRGEKVTDDPCTYVLADGRSVSLMISAAPIEDSDGKVVAAVAIGRDVTEQAEADSASLGEGL